MLKSLMELKLETGNAMPWEEISLLWKTGGDVHGYVEHCWVSCPEGTLVSDYTADPAELYAESCRMALGSPVRYTLFQVVRGVIEMTASIVRQLY